MFREGQKKQTLDNLFFVFLDTVEKLKPRIVIAENVTGILKGNAKGYVNEIINRFRNSGYEVQIFRLNAALMNVPQARERVFFIGNNQKYPKLKMKFNERPILFGEVRSEKGKQFQNQNSVYKELLEHRNKSDTCIADISKRIRGKESGYNSCINQDEKVAYTLISGGCAFRGYDGLNMSDEDCRNIQTFPQDYDFRKEDAKYICGMSVPPNMMANIALEVYKQWIEPTKAIEKS